MKRRVRKCGKCKGRLNLIGECLLCPLFESGQTPDGHRPGCWPMTSRAAAVGTNPKELAAAREVDAKAGCPTQYDQRGRPILRDRAHRKAYNRAHGLVDLDGGFGD